ncbi:GMC oxidoreductase [Ilumatobacter sp.]|uniref:GMC oxidoreductase n=1 Tax=Ilumatobacter sp. TaxID=1967498 RepID=UPI003B51AA45
MRWVVVGAGSGGCVAARRLHDAGHDVVVVDAGPDLPPDGVPSSIAGPDALAALAEPGRSEEGLVARRVRGGALRPYARGRGVGGSSAVNAMVALRGDAELYRSWGWDDSDAAFARVEVPARRPEVEELGRVDRLLLAADPRAEVLELTRWGGRRVTAAEAYLWPILSSQRCAVVADTSVAAVELDGSRRAVGVRLVDGAVVAADAVVLAAGAIHSPAIMLRSGIDAPGIGDGLSDHPSAALLLELDEDVLADDAPTVAGDSAPVGLGLATATAVRSGDVQVLALNHLGPTAPPGVAMVLVALMRPVGAGGTVRVVDDDPHAAPLVEFDLLSARSDLTRLRDGVREVLAMLARPPFSRAVRAVRIDDVGTSADALVDDDAVERWLLAHGADYVHAASSCAGALVGTHGRVAEHENLFVCDASAFPSIPDANTHLPTMMLAERFTTGWPR